MRILRLSSAIAVGFLLSTPLFDHVSRAEGLSPGAQRGHLFVRTHCATCHAIGKSDGSPLRIAPPLRDLHRMYPVESLQEALAEGIVTGHPTMPEFRLDPGQINDVIAYLKTLER
jgi:mono/diheme cytochrome c family protein